MNVSSWKGPGRIYEIVGEDGLGRFFQKKLVDDTIGCNSESANQIKF